MINKLLIPGPTKVEKELFEAMSKPMIGHRSKDYSQLHASVVTKMKEVLGVKDSRIFLFTSSASGVMEAAIRNCVEKKVLHCVGGSFADRWYKMSLACNKEPEKLEVELGKAITPEMVDEALQKDKYEAVCVTYNETSAGVENPVPEIGKMLKEKYPDVMLFVDCVSNACGIEILPEEIGIDVMVFGTQKCLSLPPGFAFGVISNRAFEKSKEVKDKGWYFDFQVMEKKAVKDQTPATPNISLLYGIEKQLENILNEGMKNRDARHREMAKITQEWAKSKGLELFPEAGYESPTVSAIKLENSTEILDKLKEKGYIVGNGYGPAKGTQIRIGHMGDWQVEDIKELLKALDEVLK